MASADETMLKNMIDAVPMKRGGKLEELGWLVTYLSSPAAEYMTGEFIVIDGGNSLGHGITFEAY